jgi:MFS transporter, FSR family, fosmidomycin resistance protein
MPSQLMRGDTDINVQVPPEPSRYLTTERAALSASSGAHFVHDGVADSLYVLLPMWAQAFGLTYTQVGGLKTAYSAAMAVFQMPAGLVAERFGERLLLAGGTVLAGGAFAAMAIATGYLSLFFMILLVGLGSAVQHPLASAIISRAYAPDQRRSALGIYNFFGDLGKMVVAFGVASAAGLVGWKLAVAGYGAVVVAAGLLLLFVLGYFALGVPSEPAQHRPIGLTKVARSDFGVTDVRGFTLLSAIHVIDSASRTGTLTLLPFVLIGKGASPSLIGLALALIFAGGAIGKLACGVLADRVGILRTLVLTEIATAGILVAAVQTHLTVTLVLMPMLGIALNGTSSVLYGTVTDFVRPDRQARIFGLFYTLGSLAGGSAPLLFGAASDWIGVSHAILGLAGLVLATLPLALLLREHLRETG